MRSYGKFLFSMLMAAIALSIFSCGGKDGAIATTETQAAAPRMSAKAAAFTDTAVFDDVVMEEAVEAEMDYGAVPEPTVAGASGGGSGGQNPAGQQERKLIKTGSISLEVEQLASAEEAVLEWCQSFGGYVASSFNHETNAAFTVRIPAVHFDAAMAAAGNLGRVRSRNVSTQDVSEQFYDLQTRLDTRKILRDRLQSYLAQAKNMEDLLHIERELNSTLTEIESMEGRMRRLSNQIDYSTITVDLQLPYRTTDQGFQWPSLDRNVRRFLSNVVDFFVDFVAIVLYIVIFGVPILALVAFLYWLLLGRMGLLKRIFKRLK
ncbi:MAG: DUF4349 domain-containing protein [Spirochaetaceae bacterium]|nr:DUF4349 domain-containing protein [Spirochaetaceae bacterium]MBQ8560547.1 DUF4349 domain-containing protein [Spirochaetaceae bacterium]